MLELRDYSFDELSAYLHTADNQGTQRKLKNYGVSFTVKGEGRKAIYTIQEITQPIKIFAIFDVGVPPQTDMIKFTYFLYEMLCDEAFSGMGAEMMEEYLRSKPTPISRQTISKYLKYISATGIMDISDTDFVYYRVYKRYGVQTHETVSKEEYSKAWRLYWQLKDEKGYGSSAAFQAMYNDFGGVPRKHGVIEKNGIYNDLIEWLTEELMMEVGEK